MEHRTTVVEFAIEPVTLFAIAQSWADEFGFSLYEKNGNRAIYSKSIRLMKAWLSVENRGENARVEAWLSGPGVGPDFEGNAWRGWKTALPQGIGFGPQFIYRKQFDALLGLLKGKTQNAIEENSPQPASGSGPILDKSILTKGNALLGIVILIGAAINLLSAASLLLKSVFPSLAREMLTSGIFSVVVGVLVFVSSRALAKGKLVAAWLYGVGILIDSIYNIIAGRATNYLFIGFGVIFIWQMLKFKNEWRLS